jgi:transcriptional regulator with XRE-family HTH domain
MVDLRAERLNRGKSVREFAAQLGVTERVLKAAEAGATPRPANALKIADFFGLKVTQMWPDLLEREAA